MPQSLSLRLFINSYRKSPESGSNTLKLCYLKKKDVQVEDGIIENMLANVSFKNLKLSASPCIVLICRLMVEMNLPVIIDEDKYHF